MADFLLELGTEEIPARMIAAAEADLARRVKSFLLRERLLEEAPAEAAEENTKTERGAAVSSYSTPRRLSVLARGVSLRQPDIREQIIGPSWKIAFPNNEPSGAAQAFAKKAGVALPAIAKLVTAKGEYTSAIVERRGREALEVLAAGLAAEIAAMPWPKAMYWRAGKPERFVRPLRWLVCMLDSAIVPLEFAGIRASNLTYGHRILHGQAPIRLDAAHEYLARLQSAYVQPDAAVRRQRIRKFLDDAAREIPGARWREDRDLVEQAANLTEWPSAIAGGFERGYLALPEEVLVTVMRGHQKYFALEGSDGRLLPHFLAVLNTEADAAGQAVIRHGNERVLRARFNDARFFWDYDQKIALRDRLERLKSVTFHQDLGSYFSKTKINIRLAEALAAEAAANGMLVDNAVLKESAELAKTDLTTELVKEFTELQGVIGGLYARAQGLGEKVAAAIAAQYLPASMDDPIPETVEGQILGLADRMATIVEMFEIGLAPSGSKDPFALRRAANGVIKILAESELPLSLGALEEIATGGYGAGQSSARIALDAFLRERLIFYLKEVRGYDYDVVNAVLAAELTTIPDAVARARSLAGVRGSADMLAISTAFRRIRNILRQAAEEGLPAGLPSAFEGAVIPGDLADKAELQLYSEVVKLAPEVESLRARRLYPEALQRIAAIRPAVDGFFDHVMVMADEARLRRNRLALIALIYGEFSKIADFSEIVA